MSKRLSNYPKKTSHPGVWYYEERGRIRLCIDGKQIPEIYKEVTIRASQLRKNVERITQ